MTKAQIYYTVISFNNILLNQPRNERNKPTAINIDVCLMLGENAELIYYNSYYVKFKNKQSDRYYILPKGICI